MLDAASSLGNRRVRVLLVDDHEIIREGICCVLTSYPEIDVIEQAVNGQEAVEKALLHKPDVILMDLNMPVMNGIEATQVIKGRLPETVVIGLTIHNEDTYLNLMLKAGAETVLTKGVSMELLYQTLMRYLPKAAD